MKLLVETIPDRSWSYQDILTWLWQIRDTWNIKDINAHDPKEIRSHLKKSEVLEFINENFECPNAPKKENEIEVPKWDCYDVVYIGEGDLYKLVKGKDIFVFVKGLSYTFYDQEAPLLLDMLTTHKEIFAVKGRNYYSHETQIIDVARKVKKRMGGPPEKFFTIF